MKKYIANIITGSRIAFSLPLLFISLSSEWFYILNLFCGLTDMIDKAIARKTGAAGKSGARGLIIKFQNAKEARKFRASFFYP